MLNVWAGITPVRRLFVNYPLPSLGDGAHSYRGLKLSDVDHRSFSSIDVWFTKSEFDSIVSDSANRHDTVGINTLRWTAMLCVVAETCKG